MAPLNNTYNTNIGNESFANSTTFLMAIVHYPINTTSFYPNLTNDNRCCGPTNCEELQICHCGEYQDTKYDIIECEHIEQKPLEKALSMLLFVYGFIVVVLCSLVVYICGIQGESL